MNRNLKFFIISITTVSAFACTGANPVHARSLQSILDVVCETTSTIGHISLTSYMSGPSTMGYMDSLSLSAGAFTIDRSTQSRPTMVQTGKGHTTCSLGVASYYKLSKNSTVWGEADYTKGTSYDISFADCLDYRMLAPYCMGDDTGGDVSTQRYRFAGGWNGSSGKWSYGLGARYRAETGHRSSDPRVRDIVSDLDIAAGGARLISNRHLLALDIGMKIYHQDCDVKFMNEANTITTLVYSGLGEIFNRFAGNQVSAIAHSGNIYKAAVSYMPVFNENGLYGHIEAHNADMSLFLREHNNLKAGFTSTMTATLSLGFKRNLGERFKAFPCFTASFSQRDGTENLFGSGTGLYDVIGHREIYRHTMADAAISIPVEWNHRVHGIKLTFTPSVAWNSDKEQLLDPVRRLSVTHITSSLALDGFKRFCTSYLHVNATGIYRKASASTPQWGALDLSTPAGAAVENNYNMLSCNVSMLTASATYGILINGFVYSINIAYSYTSHMHMAHGNAITASLSVNF